ncbi:BAG family molecular chaperone regulator 7-like [Tasmannia lanceolata]|uniref:BAG family molecular chaperone regulator 7-like n=1 Tax=Tasmannia lanceolata TaxID=3420 RepID=UPI0040639BD3
MSIFKRFELLEPTSAFLYKETFTKTPLYSPFSELENELGFALDLLNPNPFDLSLQCVFPPPPSHFEVLESAIDLIQIKKIQDRKETDFYLRNLSDRVSALELGFDRVLIPKIDGRDRKYSLQAEIKGAEKDGIDRKYKWTTEIKGGKKEGCGNEGVEKNYKWTAEIKGKGKNAPISHTYTLKASSAPAVGKPEKAKKESKGKCSGATRVVEKGSGTTRVVEIEDTDPAGLAVKQVFARKRAAAVRTIKGKNKELSPQDAAMIIQVSFRAHLVRRSQTLRGLRDLAVAKAKLKELRALFTNFSYRRRIACDAEERQRFSEKIIVLLLTVDAIEGPDYMVRAARRSMVGELEAMLDVVDPQPPGKLGSLKRRKFDLPVSSSVRKEMALGVAEVVQMLDAEDNGSNAFEACL